MKSKQAGFAHQALLLVLVFVAVAGFAGWRVYSASQQKAVNNTEEQQTEEVEETLPEDLSNLKTVEEIAKLALTEKPDSLITDIELETEDNNLVYKVVLSDGTVFKFNAASGNKIASLKQEPNEDGTLPENLNLQINLVEAVTKAKEELPGKQVRKVQFALEDGALVYSVRFTDGSRVDVHAITGEVVDVRDNAKGDSDDSDEEESSSNKGRGSKSENRGQGSSNSNKDDDSEDEDSEDDGEENDEDNSGSGSSGGGTSGSSN